MIESKPIHSPAEFVTRFISGIFQERISADKHLSRFSKPEEFRIVESSDVTHFPFYMIEKDIDFQYLQRPEDAANFVESFDCQSTKADSDNVWFNIYRVEEEFSPKPGTDSTGWLFHIHVGAWNVDALKQDWRPFLL